MSSEQTLHCILSDVESKERPVDIGQSHSKLLASIQTLTQHIAITEGGYTLPVKILFDVIVNAPTVTGDNVQTPCKTLFQALLFALKSNVFYYSEDEAKHLANSLYLLQILVLDAQNTATQCTEHTCTDLLQCNPRTSFFTLPTPLPVPISFAHNGEPEYITGWCFEHSPSHVYFLAVDAHILGIAGNATDGVHVRLPLQSVKEYITLYKTDVPR